MRNLSVFCLSLIVGIAVAGTLNTDDVREIQSRNRKELFERDQAVVDKQRKRIDGHFGGLGSKYKPNDATMQAYDERVRLDYDKNKVGHAGASRGLAKADIAGKYQGAATGYGKSGGSAFSGKDNGQMRLRKDGQGFEHADFVGNGRKQVKTVAQRDSKGKLDRYTADGEGLHAKIDPVTLDEGGSEGAVFFKNEERIRVQNKKLKLDKTLNPQDGTWLYDVKQKNKNLGTASISDQSVGSSSGKDQGFLSKLLGQKSKQAYYCEARKVGASECKDQNGKTVGKTVATDDGNVYVYNKFNVPVARGKVKKISNTKYEAQVNQGLMVASTQNIEYYDCMKEFGKKKSDQITLMKPLHFKPNSISNNNGSTTFQFPDCFEIGGKVKLAKGVDGSRIATEYIVAILPAGKLRCMDPATCGRECYYCDFCQRKHKLNALDNSKTNLCTAKGGTTIDMKATVCPPPESFNWALCSKFSKSLVEEEYWKKKGDVDVQMRFYLRPGNREQLIKDFDKQSKIPILGKAFILGLQTEFRISTGVKTGFVNPTNSELLEFYLQKNSKDQLIGCQRSVIKYGLSGSKVDNSFLIEAASSATKLPSIFQEKPCKEWSKLDQEQYEHDIKEYGSGGGSGGSGSGRGGLFGGLFGNN